MAVREIKTRLKIEGDAEYKQSIKQVNSELSTLKSEMKVVDERFAGNEKSVESLTAKSDVLSRQYDKQKEKLEILRSALKNAQTAQESANQRVEDARDKYNRAQQQLDEYKKSSDKTADGQKQLEDALENAGKELEVAERAQRKAAEAVEEYGKKSNYTQAEIYKLEKQLETANKDLSEAKNESAQAAKSVENLGNEMQDSAEKSRDFGEKSKDGVDTLAAAIAASGVKEGVREIAEAIQDCMDASQKFESAITGVYKTVDGTPEQLAAIRDGIRQMSTEIPATTTQIAGVAEAAGQLGIATDNVVDFTRVMIDLGESTNLSADEAASSLAKFANITGTAASDYSRLGSVIVGLGNNFATTEADIVGMATRLASAGTLAGLTEPQIMALAASMSSVGIEAEAGGTAMTQTLSAMEKAVASGGDKLQLFASVAGMSAREFANRWESNAISAVQSFVEGLSRMEERGESSILVLDELELSGVRQSNMLKSLSLASDQMSHAVDLANTAWTENTALAEEAGKRYETTESKVKMAENAFDNLKVTIGDQFNPILEKMSESGVDAFTWASDFVEEHPEVVGALTAVTTATGLLAVSVTGYSVATQIVIPLIQSFNAALAASPVGVTALAIGALVSILVGLAVTFSNVERPEEDYITRTKEARAATDELEEATEELNQTIKDNAYNTSQVKVYIAELKRLEQQGLDNKAVQAVYNDVLDKLRELLPGLTIEIDETTGAIKGGTDVLLMQAEALEENANAVAALEVYENAQNAVEATTLALEENKATIQMYNDEIETLVESMTGANATIKEGSDEWQETNARLYELTTGTLPALYAANEELVNELDLQQATLEEVKAEYEKYNQTVTEGNNALTDANDAYTAFTNTMDGIQTELQDLQTRYENAYQAAYENISGQFGLFQKLEEIVGTSVDDMIGSLQSQAEYMDEYALNMQKAAELGIDEGLLLELSDGSTESAKILKGIVDDGGENINKLNIQFRRVEEGKKSFSEKVAKMNTDFDKNMSEIDERLKKTVEEFNQKTAAIRNTDATIDGVVQRAYERMGDVREAYAALGRAATNAYRAEIKVNSPSKVFMAMTDSTIEGITGEVEKKKPDVAKSYQNLAGAASGAYYDATQKTQVLYAQTIRSYNKMTADGASSSVSGAQLARIADKLDDIKRATEDSRMDEDALADKLGDAVSRVQIKTEAVISARRAAEEITPEVDKNQGNTMALRRRGVV